MKYSINGSHSSSSVRSCWDVLRSRPLLLSIETLGILWTIIGTHNLGRLDKWLQKLHSIASIDSIDIPLGPHMSNEVQEVGLKVLTKIYEIKNVLEIIVWLPRFRRSQLECSCLFQACLVPIVAAAECIHNPMLSIDTLMPGQTSHPI